MKVETEVLSGAWITCSCAGWLRVGQLLVHISERRNLVRGKGLPLRWHYRHASGGLLTGMFVGARFVGAGCGGASWGRVPGYGQLKGHGLVDTA